MMVSPMKRTWVALTLGSAGLIAVVAVMGASCSSPVTVINDTGQRVFLRQCDGAEIGFDAGQQRSVSPRSPCLVYRTEGSFPSRTQFYLGCLRFSQQNFESGSVLFVSTLDRSVKEDDCFGLEDYKRFTSVGKFWRRARHPIG